MIEIHVHNNYSYIHGTLSNDFELNNMYQKSLRKELAYAVKNARFSQKYKERKWDGLISLYYRYEQRFPTGLIHRVMNYFEVVNLEYKIVDKRVSIVKNTKIENTCSDQNKTLRFYQESAVAKCLKTGRGIISLCTGEGKTLISCELIAQISRVPVVYVVPTLSLLKQTCAEFNQYLTQDGQEIEMGYIGEGVCEINYNGINITTYQSALAAFNEVFDPIKNVIKIDPNAGEKVRKTTEELEQARENAKLLMNLAEGKAIKQLGVDRYSKLTPKEQKVVNKSIKKEREAFRKSDLSLRNRYAAIENKKKVRRLIENCAVFIVDEVHLAAVVIESLSMHADKAYFKYAMTATPYREDNQEIRMEGAIGKVIYRVSASDLIKLDFLVKPHIFMCEIKHNEACESYADAYNKHIVDCWERNYRIKQFAETFKADGRPVLILVEQIAHGNILEELITDAVFVAGSDKGEDDPDDEEKDYRRRMLASMEKNEIILIATQWAYVGIDAPALQTLILAGSTTSMVTTMQQIGRVLRAHPASGKKDAVIIDFMDTQPDMHDHSNCRKRVYKTEAEFDFQIIKALG